VQTTAWSSPLTRKLSVFIELDGHERAVLADLEADTEHVRQGTELVSRGEPIERAQVVRDGWAVRSKTLPDGRRQIIDFVLPGNLIGLYAHVSPVAEETVTALTPMITAPSCSRSDPPRPNGLPPVEAASLPERSFTELYRYWTRCRGKRRMPTRAAIDPVELPRRLLPYLSIVERLADSPGPLFRFRLVGTAIEQAAGATMTWRELGEALPSGNGYLQHVLALLQAMTAQVMPVYAEGAYLTRTDEGTGVRTTCQLLLPLADERGSARYALTAQTFGLQSGIEHAPFLEADDFRPGRSAVVEG